MEFMRVLRADGDDESFSFAADAGNDKLRELDESILRFIGTDLPLGVNRFRIVVFRFGRGHPDRLGLRRYRLLSTPGSFRLGSFLSGFESIGLLASLNLEFFGLLSALPVRLADLTGVHYRCAAMLGAVFAFVTCPATSDLRILDAHFPDQLMPHAATFCDLFVGPLAPLLVAQQLQYSVPLILVAPLQAVGCVCAGSE